MIGFKIHTEISAKIKQVVMMYSKVKLSSDRIRQVVQKTESKTSLQPKKTFDNALIHAH
jgi:hypothetical protein